MAQRATRLQYLAPLLALTVTCKSPTEPSDRSLPPIVFAVDAPTGRELYAVNLSDSLLRPLTSGGYGNYHPNWYDDHRRIAFGSTRSMGGYYSMLANDSDITRIHSFTNDSDITRIHSFSELPSPIRRGLQVLSIGNRLSSAISSPS